MANKIGLITKWSVEMFDEAYVAGSRSSVLDANKGLLQFTGAKTVRFPKWNGEGLYNYNRANDMQNGRYLGQSTSMSDGTKGYGYQQGDANLIWEERTMRVDRAVQYRIDETDNEETQNKAVAFATGQINKQKIIPEIDAYCFSQIVYEACSPELGNYVEATKDIGAEDYQPLKYIDEAVAFLQENEVEEDDLVGFVSPRFELAMRRTNEVTRVLRPKDFNEKINFKVSEYDDIPFINVPTRRMYTNVILGPGKFYPDPVNSKRIDLLIVAKSAVYHVVKYQTIKVFGKEVVQDYDGYKINARVYHDVFVPDNKKIACYVVVANSSDALKLKAAEPKLAVRTVPGTAENTFVIDGLTTIPGSLYWNKLYYKGGSDSAPTVGGTISTEQLVEVYETVTDSTNDEGYFCITDNTDKIIAVTAKLTINKKKA